MNTKTIEYEGVAEKVREWCDSVDGNAAFRRISGVKAAFSGWTRGGCGLLTMALVEMFPEGKAQAFVAPDGEILHIAFKFDDDLLIDGDGGHSLSDLIERYDRVAQELSRRRLGRIECTLESVVQGELESRDIFCPAAGVIATKEELVKVLHGLL